MTPARATSVDDAAAILLELGEFLDAPTVWPAGALTTTEEAVLSGARVILDAVKVLTGEDPVAASVVGVLNSIPWEGLLRLVMGWRRVSVRAHELGVTIGPLGPDVAITVGEPS